MATKMNLTSPVGRVVEGDFYKPNTTDAEGRPLVYKTGPDAGKPRVDYYFALAIPKGPEAQHGAFGWMATEWGQKIRQVGEAFMAHATQLPGFAWKVTDGDSQIPNKNGRKPCDREGFKGHWVLKFSGGYAPKIYNANGTQAIVEPGAVKPGYFVQVNFDVDSNGSQSQPGVYLNHRMVALAGYGPEIHFGPDPSAAGFGVGVQLPPGASATPPAGFTPPQAPGAPAVPAIPGTPAPAMAPPAALPPTGGPAYSGAPVPPAVSVPPMLPPAVPAAVMAPPNPAFLQVPSVPAAPAAPARKLTDKAGGASYEQLIGAGWTDQTLIQHGLMTV
nr:hypothetical protein [uncultured Roseateles sp.]